MPSRTKSLWGTYPLPRPDEPNGARSRSSQILTEFRSPSFMTLNWMETTPVKQTESPAFQSAMRLLDMLYAAARWWQDDALYDSKAPWTRT